MYQVGEKVVYGIHGVCRVADLEERIIDRKHLTYLVLAPEGQDGSKYLVPTHNAGAMSKLCKLLTPAEMEELFQSDAIARDCWVKDENQRKQLYRELICSTDRAALMAMVRTLYRQKASLLASGKKFHLCDENFLRDAEKRLASELEYVLNTDFDQARNYLRQKLKAE